MGESPKKRTGRWSHDDDMIQANLYPRLSIDTSRRVRQLAHTLQGRMAISGGKRMARHMPKVAASWLAGQYDNDKSASRAANESLRQVFSSTEKMKTVWRLYQTSILEYARDVIVKETANTLSDKRTTSPDDSSAKYSRVVSASLMMVTHLIESISDADIEKCRTLLNGFLHEDKLWKLATDSDASVRRTLYRFLGTILAQHKDALNSSTISARVLMPGLNTSQSGSAFDFAKILVLLSVELPDVWTTSYPASGKKSAADRLCHFLKKGSQGGPPEFWVQIAQLLPRLPPSVLAPSVESELDKEVDSEKDLLTPVLSALHEGLNSKNEPRGNNLAAWEAYLTTSELVLSSVPDASRRHRILTSSVWPILARYIRPSSENARWAVTGTAGQEACFRACNQAILQDPDYFREEWNSLSSTTIEAFKVSLPEQAKDYAKSQDSLSADADRWYSLQATLLKGNGQDTASSIFKETVPAEINSAVSVLQSRIGKPYGVATALEIAIQKLPDLVLGNDACKANLLAFVNEALPQSLLSPSAKHYIGILNNLDGLCDVSRSYDRCMQMLGQAPESQSKQIALQSFISSPRLAVTDSLLALVIASLNHAMTDDNPMSWNLVMAALSNPVAPKSLTDDVLANITEGLSISSKIDTGLRGLEMTIKQNPREVTEFARSHKGSSLLSNLLLLTDSPDDGTARRAKHTSATIEQVLESQGGTGQTMNSLADIVKKGLDTTEAGSLSYVDYCLISNSMDSLTVA